MTETTTAEVDSLEDWFPRYSLLLMRMHCNIPVKVNLNKPSGLSHPYQLDESTSIFRGIRTNFSFFDEIPVSKQYRPRCDAVFCGVTSGAILFAYVPKIGRQAYVGYYSE